MPKLKLMTIVGTRPEIIRLAADAKLVKVGIESGCGTDAPGSYIAWLCKQTKVHAMEMPGKRYDIGDIKSYNKVREEYKGIMHKNGIIHNRLSL